VTSLLTKLFEEKLSRGEKVFVAYLTAGDPNAKASVRLIETLSKSGADVIELGVPHTDPIADGVTNARAAERALETGGGIRQTLSIAAELRKKGVLTPLVLFTYLNPLIRMGLESFAKTASQSGIDGVLVVDMPPEEAGTYCQILKSHQLDTIFLASPTTSDERLTLVNSVSSGFVYYVSRAGVTGAKQDVPLNLKTELERVRKKIEKPICVGFGISTPKQVSEIAQLASGVVVGSALVRCIEENKDQEEAANTALASLTRQLVAALPKRGVK
jgi:tryptophan synthase alpha chain